MSSSLFFKWNEFSCGTKWWQNLCITTNFCGEAEHLTLLKHCHENHFIRCQCHVVMSSVIQGFFLLVFALLRIMSRLISMLRNHLNSFLRVFKKKISDDYILYISTRSCMFFKAVRLAIHFSAEVFVRALSSFKPFKWTNKLSALMCLEH